MNLTYCSEHSAMQVSLQLIQQQGRQFVMLFSRYFRQSRQSYWRTWSDMGDLIVVKMLVKISLILILGKYMNASKSKKKRPLSGVPKGSALASLIPPKITNPYGAKVANTQRKSSSKNSNSKITQKSSGARIHTSDYDFPEFAVAFKDNAKKRRTIDHSLLDMPKASYREDSTRRNRIKAKEKARVAGKTIANISYGDNIKNTPKGKEYPTKLEGKVFEKDFREAVGKVFRLLDIFNRGKISQTNINKWIPEAALYFLGSVFQKIKAGRLTLSVEEFTGLCLPLLTESNPEDIRQFIAQTRIAPHLKNQANISIPQQPKTTEIGMSPIKRRMMMEQMQRSSKKATPSAKKYQAQEGPSGKKTQMEDMLAAIKNRENEMTERMTQIQEKRKSVSFHNVLEEIHSNRIIQYDQPQSYQQVEPPSNKLSAYNSPQRPMLKSILKNSNKYTSPNPPPNSAEQRRSVPQPRYEINDFNSPVIANFTFQLPPEPSRQPQIQIKTANSIVDCQTKQSQLEDFLKLRLDRSQTYEKSHSVTKLDHCRQQLRYEVKSKTHRRQNDSDDVRLERLHSRIEEYMRRNADKLQRSRMFLQSQRGEAVNIF